MKKWKSRIKKWRISCYFSGIKRVVCLIILIFFLHGYTGQKAYMSGKLKVKGQIMLAMKLDSVFKSIKPAGAKL